MSTGERYERDGNVAVLYSPGSGAGWYTWNTEHPELPFDPEIVTALLEGEGPVAAVAVAERKYPGVYVGGGRHLTVEWVPKGSRFVINEYDGAESVDILGPDYGLTA